MDDARCSIEACDIFDFMAYHVGMTVLHPGGLWATEKLVDAVLDFFREYSEHIGYGIYVGRKP